jgi:hypothetical protein
MLRTTLLITSIFLFCGCKSTSTAQLYAINTGTEIEPTSIDLTKSKLANPIDYRPFQFWLQTRPQKILATNRSKGSLNYTSQNASLDIPVSEQAIQCMRHVFATIERENIKESKQWKEFKERFPYRFLEVLPDIKDFYTQTNPAPEIDSYNQFTVPVLWNGFQAIDNSAASDSRFKLRGYLKWSGVLLPDGITCLVATSKQVLNLLEQSKACEEGNLSSCNIPTEIDP